MSTSYDLGVSAGDTMGSVSLHMAPIHPCLFVVKWSDFLPINIQIGEVTLGEEVALYKITDTPGHFKRLFAVWAANSAYQRSKDF